MNSESIWDRLHEIIENRFSVDVGNDTVVVVGFGVGFGDGRGEE